MIISEHVIEIKIAVNDETPLDVDILAVYDVVGNQLTFVRQGKRKREELFGCSGCEANEIALFLQRIGEPTPRQIHKWNTTASDSTGGSTVASYTPTNVRGPEDIPF